MWRDRGVRSCRLSRLRTVRQGRGIVPSPRDGPAQRPLRRRARPPHPLRGLRPRPVAGPRRQLNPPTNRRHGRRRTPPGPAAARCRAPPAAAARGAGSPGGCGPSAGPARAVICEDLVEGARSSAVAPSALAQARPAPSAPPPAPADAGIAPAARRPKKRPAAAPPPRPRPHRAGENPAQRRVPSADPGLVERRGRSFSGWAAPLLAVLVLACCAAVLWWHGLLPARAVRAVGLPLAPDHGPVRLWEWALVGGGGAVALLAVGGIARGRAGSAWVLSLFGQYRGSVRRTGLVWINPMGRRGFPAAARGAGPCCAAGWTSGCGTGAANRWPPWMRRASSSRSSSWWCGGSRTPRGRCSPSTTTRRICANRWRRRWPGCSPSCPPTPSTRTPRPCGTRSGRRRHATPAHASSPVQPVARPDSSTGHVHTLRANHGK